MENKISLKKLKGVPVTLLIPLRARYLETKRIDGILSDPKSVDIIDSIEHDFAESELPWDGQMVISARTEILDEATKKFMDQNPDAVVVNLGCGLDTRFERIDNGQVLWYDLDLSECIEIRQKFFQENDRYKFIAKSVLDFSWFDEIPKDRKVFFIAEGLLPYFPEDQVKSIVLSIMRNFPDSELIFEAYSMLIKRSWHRHRHIKRAFSMFQWGVYKGKSLEKWHERISFLKEYHYVDRHPARWKWMQYFRYITPLHQIMKIVHLRLDPHLS